MRSPSISAGVGDHLLVFRDEQRHRKRGNAGNYVSTVGLGCLLEYLTVAASGEGLAAQAEFSYQETDPAGPWLAVSFTIEETKADDLLPGLRLRCSERRPYQGGDLAHPVFEQVMADADPFENRSLYLARPAEDDLLQYQLQCEEFLWADQHILPEMLSWVRWSGDPCASG